MYEVPPNPLGMPIVGERGDDAEAFTLCEKCHYCDEPICWRPGLPWLANLPGSLHVTPACWTRGMFTCEHCNDPHEYPHVPAAEILHPSVPKSAADVIAMLEVKLDPEHLGAVVGRIREEIADNARNGRPEDPALPVAITLLEEIIEEVRNADSTAGD